MSSTMMNGHRVLLNPGQVADPWDYQDPSLSAVAKCRTIPVTLAMQEKDQQLQRARLRPSDWKLGAEIRNRRPGQP